MVIEAVAGEVGLSKASERIFAASSTRFNAQDENLTA